MKQGKRWFVLALAALSLTMGMTGCQDITQQTGAGNVTLNLDKNLLPDTEIGNKTVKYLYPGSQTNVDKDLDLQATLKLLKEKYGVEVEFEFVPAQSYATRLSAVVAGGNAPDLVEERDNANQGFIKNKLVQSIDEHFDMDSKLWSGMKEYINQASWNGKILQMPLKHSIISQILYYNKKLFDEAGLDYPSEYVKRDEWNWDTMLELAQELTVMGSNGKPEVYGIADYNGSALMQSAGTDFVTQDENGKFIGHLGGKALTDTMNFHYDLGAKRYNVLYMGRGDDAFPAGKVAMVCDATTKLAFFKDMMEYIDVVPIPAYPKSDVKYARAKVTRSPFIAIGAENVEGAAAFINCRRLVYDVGNTRENEIAVMRSMNSLPAGPETDAILNKIVDIYREGYEYVEPRASMTLYADLGTYWDWGKKLTQPWSTVEASWKTVFETKVAELNGICDAFG